MEKWMTYLIFLPNSMRSKWKHFFFLRKIFKNVEKEKKFSKVPRNVVIHPLMFQKEFLIHNGKDWSSFHFSNLGCSNKKFGEFLWTRQYPSHLSKKKKKVETKKKN